MSFDKRSQELLTTVNPKLVAIANRVEEIVHHKVICGARTKEAQEAAFAAGNSKKHYPEGKHCVGPEAGRDFSDAIDFAPLTSAGKIDWNDELHFIHLGVTYMDVAKSMSIETRYGGDFNMDGKVTREWDFGHIELL